MAEKKAAGSKTFESRVKVPPASSRRTTSRRRFLTCRATAGDTVTLPCRLSSKTSAVTREVRWFKGTNCVKLFQRKACEENEETSSAINREELSLTLSNVKITDSGQYRCEVLAEKKREVAVIHLHVAAFKLVFDSDEVREADVRPLTLTYIRRQCAAFFYGEDVQLPCFLSPETSAVAMEIRWFKGTDCVYLYQNGLVTEGQGYEGKISVTTDELQRGNVSLNLTDVQESDEGEYRCEVTDGEQMDISNFKLFVSGSLDILHVRPVQARVGDHVFLLCFLFPRFSAVTMEIRWFKGKDCVYLYQNGQVTEGRGYEGRVSLITDELEDGNVCLDLRDVQRSDSGEYRCEVRRGKSKVESEGVNLSVTEFNLVYSLEDVGKRFDSFWELSSQYQSSPHKVYISEGYDVALPCFLSPETSAVTMEIRWFKGTDCVYLYQNGQVMEGQGYEGRVSVITDELQRGNVSLNLKEVQESDEGEYRCEVTDGEEKVDISVQLEIQTFERMLQRHCAYREFRNQIREWTKRMDGEYPSEKSSDEEESAPAAQLISSWSLRLAADGKRHTLVRTLSERPGRKRSTPNLREISGFTDQDGYKSS